MLGFMPPFLARELYSCGAGSPKEPIIEGWGRDIMSETSQEPLLISEMSKDHRGEVVYSETRWFFSKRGRDDFAFALKTYGISAATHAGKHDALVLLGAHKSDWEESLLPRKAGHGLYGLRYAVAARVSAQLAEKPRLTNDAVSALRKIQAAYTVGDSALARKLILDFFRAHGTHYLPGPFRFGGLLFAVTLDPPVGMEDVDLRGQREKTDKVFGAEFAKYGVDIRCGEGHTWNLGSDAKFVQDSVGTRRDGGETGDSGHEGIIFRVCHALMFIESLLHAPLNPSLLHPRIPSSCQCVVSCVLVEFRCCIQRRIFA